MCKYPKTELIAIERCIYGGWKVVVLINDDYYETLHYYGYTRAEAKQKAKAESSRIAATYFFNQS